MATVKFRLTESQMKKLHSAHIKKEGIVLELSSHMIHENGIPLKLTKTEYAKLMKGGIHRINISASRVKSGGFLPALLAALPTIVTAISGVAGATSLAKTVHDWVKGKGVIQKNINYVPKGKGTVTSYLGSGVISDLNIPIISKLASYIGLGKKTKRKRGKSLYWSKS